MAFVVTVGRCYAPFCMDERRRSESPGKVVGRRTLPASLSSREDSKAAAIAWRRAFPTPFVPRGVYRFRSHEEADEWLWKMITRNRRA